MKKDFGNKIGQCLEVRAKSDCASSEMKGIFECLSNCAIKTVGKKTPNKQRQYCDDPEIVRMVEERKALLLKCNQINDASDKSSLRK